MFSPLLVDAARRCRHAVGDRWFVDEAFSEVAIQLHGSSAREASSLTSSLIASTNMRETAIPPG